MRLELKKPHLEELILTLVIILSLRLNFLISAMNLGDVAGTKLDLDYGKLGTAIWEAIKLAADPDVITAEQLNITYVEDNITDATVASMIKAGTPIFDALLFAQAGAPEGANLTKINALPKDANKRQADQTKQLAWTVMYCLIRGNYPSGQTAEVGKDIPAILDAMFKLGKSPNDVVASIASFNINHLPMDWIKGIDLSKLPLKLKNRLTLGLPGYRYVNVFKAIPVAQEISQEWLDRVNWVREFASYPYDWNVFTPTRSSEFLEKVGSFNKLLMNLMVNVYSEEELNYMVAQRMLPRIPEYTTGSLDWSMVPPVNSLPLNSPIFGGPIGGPGGYKPWSRDDLQANRESKVHKEIQEAVGRDAKKDKGKKGSKGAPGPGQSVFQ